MSASNVLRLWREAIRLGEPLAVVTGDIFIIKPDVDNTGTFQFGDGTTDMDVKVMLGASTDFVLFDISAGNVQFDNAELVMGDADEIAFGDGSDVTMAWDGTDFDILPAANNSIIKFGNGTLSFDLWVYGSAAANYISWDASANDLKFEDSVSLMFGTGAGAGPGTAGDVEIRWDGTDLDVLAAANNSIIKFGNGTNSFDLWVYGSAAANYISWDASANDLKFEDNVSLMFGTGAGAGPGTAGDIEIKWDTTDLLIDGAAANTAIKIGATNNQDLYVYGATATNYVHFDTDDTAKKVTFEHFHLELQDASDLRFGDSDDVTVQWNATYLAATSLANPMWTAAPSMLDPNFRAVAYGVDDDFTDGYDQTATVGRWTLFEVGTGTDALDDVSPGGVLLLTCQATTDNACEQINHTGAAFKLAAGKTLWFEARFKLVGDATQSEVSLGLINVGEDLTAVADVLPQDGISFSKQDAAAAMDLTCSKNGTDTGAVAAVHTLVNDTWVTLGFLVTGVTSVTPYINGVAGTAATATICDDELLTPYLLVRNGDATTQEVLHVDYVKCVQLR